MESNIKGFPNYYWDGKDIWNINKNKVIKQTCAKRSNTTFAKMKDSLGKWDSVATNTIRALSGESVIPEDFTEVPHTNGKLFLNSVGVVYSTQQTLVGVELKPYYGCFPDGSPKYPTLSVNYKGKLQVVNIHQLMCVTFYDADYIEKGLVCLHKDNDKRNFRLSNLKIGTYSENNKQAYDDGINQGNLYGVS